MQSLYFLLVIDRRLKQIASVGNTIPHSVMDYWLQEVSHTMVYCLECYYYTSMEQQESTLSYTI